MHQLLGNCISTIRKKNEKGQWQKLKLKEEVRPFAHSDKRRGFLPAKMITNSSVETEILNPPRQKFYNNKIMQQHPRQELTDLKALTDNNDYAASISVLS